MARIEYDPDVIDDLSRFLDHMRRFDVDDAAARIAAIVQSMQVLAHSPLIGRRTDRGQRELVIGRGAQGYVALYRYDELQDSVMVLAIRSQRERGFDRDR